MIDLHTMSNLRQVALEFAMKYQELENMRKINADGWTNPIPLANILTDAEDIYNFLTQDGPAPKKAEIPEWIKKKAEIDTTETEDRAW